MTLVESTGAAAASSGKLIWMSAAVNAFWRTIRLAEFASQSRAV
jgi:hypothetical protein